MEQESPDDRKEKNITLLSVASTSTNYGDSQYVLDGIDVVNYFPEQQHQETEDQDTVLSRFVRNEITYDEFMRISGGTTIEQEIQNAGANNNILQLENSDAVPGTSTMDYIDTHQPVASDLPFFVKNLVKEVISKENNPDAVEFHQDNEEPQIPSESSAFSSFNVKVPARKIAKTMNSLLGQANVEFARGNTQDALNILLEVIRTDPRNAAAYQQVSDMYTYSGDKEKSLQYGLLAAHLDSKTAVDEWVRLGDLSTELNIPEQAVASFAKASRLDVGNFEYYTKWIAAADASGNRPLAMRVRLLAMQQVDQTDPRLSWEWFVKTIQLVSVYYCDVNDEDKAVSCMEIFITRARDFKEDASKQLEDLLKMLFNKQRYLEASRVILALVDGIHVIHASGPNIDKDAIQIYFVGGCFFIRPYPPPDDVKFIIENEFPTKMICRLIVCFNGISKKDLADKLKEILLKRNLSDNSLLFHIVEVARSYQINSHHKAAKMFIEIVKKYGQNAELYYIHGNALQALKQLKDAKIAFEKCLEINPTHVDARINLAGLLLKAGDTESALNILRGCDLEGCSNLPDERLLVHQANVLFEEQKSDQFIRIVRMLLTPHFYDIYRNSDFFIKRRSRGIPLSNTLRTISMSVVQNTTWEKFIKRLGQNAANEGRTTNDLDVTTLHDFCYKLLESLMLQEKYHDALVVCCYSFLQPRISKTDKIITFRNLLYYCAIKAGCWHLAFEFIRWMHSSIMNGEREATPQLHKRIFNAMNYVFCHSQNVAYHRFIMRALTKSPGNHALQAISGNNSLITGTYRHALGEYLQVWNQNQKNPLICLLLALTFTHMSCKKDLSSRHLIALRGIAFMKKYEKVRACIQEVWYNIGRMFHQMSIIPLAIHFYEKVLNSPPPKVTSRGSDGSEVLCNMTKYDLRPFAAHNLALIYRTSGNDYLARQIYEKYVVF